MKIRANKLMTNILENKHYDFLNQSIELPGKLLEHLDSGFRKEQDCIVFGDSEDIGSGGLITDYDKTWFEDFFNHIHTDDYVLEVIDEFEYLKIGLEFGKRLYKELKKSFKQNFRIIISFYETTYSEKEIETYGSCTVRFYTIRKSCDDIFKSENLEDFQIDAVMEIE